MGSESNGVLRAAWGYLSLHMWVRAPSPVVFNWRTKRHRLVR